MKRIIKTIAITSLGLAFLSSCVLSRPTEQAQTPRTITVSGTGSVSVKPDMVSLKFIVRNSGWNIMQVAERNAINTTNTINALKEAGVVESDISTFDYSISQDNTHTYAGEYTARNTISVIVRNLENTGKVIDAAVKNNIGANGITSFEYLVSDKTTALREARTLAIKNAQDAASLLAGASGCKVNGVMEIKEDYTSAGRNNDMLFKAVSMSMDGATPTTPIMEGNVTISSNVTVTYELSN
ncbi:MAG: SIMPL domain-containing protein [Treponema sp.]|nr:SIMPL domain-containing protein [Treponema sp.]